MKICLQVALLLLASAVRADRMYTTWWWQGWQVETSENLFDGATHHSYPATYLFDNNPRTAWVFSGQHHGNYWITVNPPTGVTIDGLEVMNGYNKSKVTFRRNRRVAKLEIWRGGPWFEGQSSSFLMKSTSLSDRPGWHRVSLPRKAYDDGITLRLMHFSGADSLDIALSGLRFLSKGRRIDPKLPNVVAFTTGSDCG